MDGGIQIPGFIVLIFINLLKGFICHHIITAHAHLHYESDESTYSTRGKAVVSSRLLSYNTGGIENMCI